MGISFGGAVIGCTALVAVLAGLISAVAGCASAMGDKQSGQACTRTDQCAPGLACSGGLCVTLSTRPHPNRSDAEAFDEDAGDGAAGQGKVRK
jgi:hypothetical protein